MKLTSETIISQAHIDLLREVHMQKLNKGVKRIPVSFALLGIALLLTQLLELNYFALFFGVFLLIVAFTIIPLSSYINKKVSNKLNKALLADENKNIIEFDTDHAIITSYLNNQKIVEHKLFYSKVIKAIFYKDCLFLYIAQNQAYIILTQDMTEGTFADLIPLLKTQIGNKFTIINK